MYYLHRLTFVKTVLEIRRIKFYANQEIFAHGGADSGVGFQKEAHTVFQVAAPLVLASVMVQREELVDLHDEQRVVLCATFRPFFGISMLQSPEITTSFIKFLPLSVVITLAKFPKLIHPQF
ncbi:hypothetical protein [Haemophilus influenzae]|uniref:hypothetical protein n=1 Tax=Haemophilus influenzae TaxID=727 RepID=UPI003BF793A1